MAYLIPETLTRLQATAFIDKRELGADGEDGIIGNLAKKLADQTRYKMLRECIKVEDVDDGGRRLRLDVYLLSPGELEGIIAEARSSGAKDAMRFLPQDGKL